MNERSPSLQEWTSLCEAAADFHRAGCWNWMADTDIFGIQDPEDGEIGYCCVMGNARELFGLAVYPGSMGLLAYEMVATGALKPGELDVLDYQRCLMVDFEDRRALRPFDLEVIKNTGVKFRGRKSWPCFTSYRPGYVPWTITSKEARFLTTAIRQTIEVARRFETDNTLLDSPEPGDVFFVRIPTKQKTGLTWSDNWREPAPIEVEDTSLDQLEAFRLKRLSKRISASDATWEVDGFLGPIIGDKTDPDARPCFGRVFLCVDQSSLFVLNSHVTAPNDPLSSVRTGLIQSMEDHGTLPKSVFVRKQEVFDVLEPVAELLGFELRLTSPLRALNHAQRALTRFFETGE